MSVRGRAYEIVQTDIGLWKVRGKGSNGPCRFKGQTFTTFRAAEDALITLLKTGEKFSFQRANYPNHD